jgi:hypothetical protein
MMATKKSKAWMDDGDDAHFDGNPAVKKHHAKKRIGASGKGHPAVKVTKKAHKKTTRKRVAGK